MEIERQVAPTLIITQHDRLKRCTSEQTMPALTSQCPFVCVQAQSLPRHPHYGRHRHYGYPSMHFSLSAKQKKATTTKKEHTAISRTRRESEVGEKDEEGKQEGKRGKTKSQNL